MSDTEEEDFSPLIAMTTAILVLGVLYVSILCLDVLMRNGYFQHWPTCRRASPKRSGIEEDRPAVTRRRMISTGEEREMVTFLRGTGVWAGFDVVNNAIYEPSTVEYKRVPSAQQRSSDSDQEPIGHRQVVMCEVHEIKAGAFINDSIISLSSSEGGKDAPTEAGCAHTDEEEKVEIRQQKTALPSGLSQVAIVKESIEPSCKINITESATWKAITDAEMATVGEKDGFPLEEDTMYVRMSSRPRIGSAQEVRPVHSKPRFPSQGSPSFRLIRKSQASSGHYIEMSSDFGSTISSIITNEADFGSQRTSETLDPTILNESITPCRGGRLGMAGRYVNVYSDSESNRSSTKTDSADSWSWALTADARPVSSTTVSTDRGSERQILKRCALIDDWFDTESISTRKQMEETEYESMSSHSRFLQEVCTLIPSLPEASGQSFSSLKPSNQNLPGADGHSLSVPEALGQELYVPKDDLCVSEKSEETL